MCPRHPSSRSPLQSAPVTVRRLTCWVRVLVLPTAVAVVAPRVSLVDSLEEHSRSPPSRRAHYSVVSWRHYFGWRGSCVVAAAEATGRTAGLEGGDKRPASPRSAAGIQLVVVEQDSPAGEGGSPGVVVKDSQGLELLPEADSSAYRAAADKT